MTSRNRNIYRTLASLMVLAIFLPGDAFGATEVLIGSESRSARFGDADVEGSLLVAIDTPYQLFDAGSSLVHVAAWAPDGRAAARADVYLDGEFLGRADRNGTFVFRWASQEGASDDIGSDNPMVEVRWRDGRAGVRGGSVPFRPYDRTESFASSHLYVYTDRGVYQPGDRVNLRLIAWQLQSDYGPLADTEVEVALSGPSGGTITGALVTTNDFGVAWSGLELPTTLEEGRYELVVSWGMERAETTLRVERFVPPVIDIEHSLGRFLTHDATALSWDATLGYVQGGELGAAIVRVQVSARGAVRYESLRRVEGAGPHAFSIDGPELDRITADLDDRDIISVRMSVEDDSGRVDAVTRDITWAANPYVAVIEADRDAWSTGDPIELMVRVTDVERVPLRDTELRLEATDGTTHSARTDAAGIAQFSLVMGEAEFNVDVFVPDVERPVASRRLAWQELQPMRSHIADAVVQENEETEVRITFPASFEPAEEYVHLDVTDTSGAIVNAALIRIREEDGRFVATGSFRAPSWGSMLLTFFCLGRDSSAAGKEPSDEYTPLGLLTEGQNLAVHPGRELEIQLDGVPDRVDPGAELALGVRVRDAQGEPVDAAVGLAIVDEGVIGMKDPIEITPMDVFYNPELRVISTTGSAILTWPVVSRSWGEHRHDIALPPFPFKPGGPIGGDHEERTMINGMGMAGSAGAIGSGGGSDAVDGAGSGAGGLGMVGQGLSGGGAAYDFGGVDTPPDVAPEAHFLMEQEIGGTMGRRSTPARAAPERTITIRAERPETFLWAPDVLAREGTAGIRVDMPDIDARQQIFVVASDANGGVGVARATFDAARALAARSDLPATVVRGEPLDALVSVRNNTDRAERVVLSLRSDVLEVLGAPVTVDVPPGEARSATIPVVGRVAGDAPFAVFAQGRSLGDAVRGTIRILPAGVRSRSVSAGVVDGGSYSLTLPRADDAEWREVSLRVLFPAVTSAFAGTDALLERLATEPLEQLAGDLVTGLLVLRTREEAASSAGTATEREHLQEWRARLGSAITVVLAAQHEDGGWGPAWTDGSRIFVSTWCLEALLEARAMDFNVPSESMRRAIAYVLGALDAGDARLDDIDLWEGDTARVWNGVRAEALHVLARLAWDRLDGEQREVVRGHVADAFESAPADGGDVLTTAHVLGAAASLASHDAPVVDAETLQRHVDALIRLRREGHWEPSWFHAFGGQIEANVVLLSVIDFMDRPDADRIIRETLRALMATSSSLGSWHNESGSAWLLRALARFAPPAPADAQSVVITIGGQEIDRVPIDPADPWGAAMRLQMVDLSEAVRDGGREVEVRVEGEAAPRVEVIDDVWR